MSNSCWYCYWGWAVPAAKIFNEAKRRLDGWDDPLTLGPAHIVWADENFDDNSIKVCLDSCDKNKTDWPDDIIVVVKWSLEELLKIPEKDRDIEPQASRDDEDSSAELFPPTCPVMRPYMI